VESRLGGKLGEPLDDFVVSLDGGLAVSLGGGVAATLGGRLSFALGGGDAVSGALRESRLRDGNGGAGLDPIPDLPLEGTSLVSVSVVGVGGSLSLSSGLAPGIFPTLFGGGAKVLTSLTAMVAKCRPPTSFSSSFFPLKGTIISLPHWRYYLCFSHHRFCLSDSRQIRLLYF
jgi:hypothetical protein